MTVVLELLRGAELEATQVRGDGRHITLASKEANPG